MKHSASPIKCFTVSSLDCVMSYDQITRGTNHKRIYAHVLHINSRVQLNPLGEFASRRRADKRSLAGEFICFPGYGVVFHTNARRSKMQLVSVRIGCLLRPRRALLDEIKTHLLFFLVIVFESVGGPQANAYNILILVCVFWTGGVRCSITCI